VAAAAVRRRARLPRAEGKTTRDWMMGTRSRVTATRSRETATRSRVTTTRTRVPATRVRRIDVNMAFTILTEFRAPTEDVAELVLGVKCAVLEKPKNLGVLMKPLFIRGHLDGTSIGHMLIDGGASINILPLSLFKTRSSATLKVILNIQI
jgi:hypothetical protein